MKSPLLLLGLLPLLEKEADLAEFYFFQHAGQELKSEFRLVSFGYQMEVHQAAVRL